MNTRPDKKFAQRVGQFASIIVALGLMTWGMTNLWTNVIAYKKNPADNKPKVVVVIEGPDVGQRIESEFNYRPYVISLFVLLTSCLPFAMGVWFLIRALK